MRKIEQQMVAAIRAGKPLHSDNTSVTHDASGCAVWLHGNQIAFLGDGETRWTLAGWNTPTTRSRVNALARAFNWKGVCCIKGLPYTQDAHGKYTVVIDATDWVNAL